MDCGRYVTGSNVPWYRESAGLTFDEVEQFAELLRIRGWWWVGGSLGCSAFLG
jgi:hypothetical protein